MGIRLDCLPSSFPVGNHFINNEWITVQMLYLFPFTLITGFEIWSTLLYLFFTTFQVITTFYFYQLWAFKIQQ